MDGVLELKVVRDQGLHIDGSLAHESEDGREHMCITEDGLDLDLLNLTGYHVQLDGAAGMANQNDGTTGRNAVEDSFAGLVVASGLEEIVGSPALCFFVHTLGEVFL